MRREHLPPNDCGSSATPMERPSGRSLQTPEEAQATECLLLHSPLGEGLAQAGGL